MFRRYFGRMNPGTIKKVVIALTILLALILGFIISYFMTSGRLKDIYEAKIGNLQNTIKENERVVYEAVDNIPKGTNITEDMVTLKPVLSGQNQKLYIDRDDIGKVTLVDIKKGTYITNVMITKEAISNELRESEFEVIHINSNIVNNDFIDVRIMFPNGENFIILSKKQIKNITADTGDCFLWLSEEETLLISSAIVDAYLYTGAKIYTTKYIQPTLQEASTVNYEPSLSTMQLIKDNPNIIKEATNSLSKKLRKELENRLADSIGLDVTSVKWDNVYADTNEEEIQENSSSESNPNNSTPKSSIGANNKVQPTVPADNVSDAASNISKKQQSNPFNKDHEVVTYQDQEDAKEADADYGP